MSMITWRHFVAAIVLGAFQSIPPALAKEPIRIDASSDRKVETSYKRMFRSLDAQRQMQLQIAVLQLNMVGVSSASEMLANPELKNPSPVRIKDRIGGLDADEIIRLAAETATTRVVIEGQEPGVPVELLRPLAAGDVTRALGATRWKLVTDINGHVNERIVELLDGGKLKSEPAGMAPDAWEQSADEVRISLNGGYAVNLGTLLDDGHMKGTGGNRMGTRWTWTATRL